MHHAGAVLSKPNFGNCYAGINPVSRAYPPNPRFCVLLIGHLFLRRRLHLWHVGASRARYASVVRALARTPELNMFFVVALSALVRDPIRRRAAGAFHYGHQSCPLPPGLRHGRRPSLRCIMITVRSCMPNSSPIDLACTPVSSRMRGPYLRTVLSTGCGGKSRNVVIWRQRPRSGTSWRHARTAALG